MVCPHHSAPEQPPEVRRIPFNFRGIAAIDTDPWSQLHALNSAPELFYSPELGGHWCAARRERREELTAWVHSFFHATDAEETNLAHRKTVAFLSGWLDDYLDAREANPSYIMTSLLDAKIDGRPLNRDEMLSILITLFNGGLDTVAAQMSHIVRHLAEHPAEREELLKNPGMIP